MQTYYGLTNDVLFKLAFGNPEKPRLLICLINALLCLEGEDAVVHVEILNPYKLQVFMGDKPSILDVKAKDGRG